MGEVYGTPPGWRVEDYKIDKSGAVVLEVIKPWEPILVADGNILTLPDIPEPPTIAGFRVGAGGWKRTVAGGMALSYNYEGVQQPAGGGREKLDDEIGVRWSGRGSLFQKDIRTIPNWDAVRKLYGWKEKEKEFPDELPKDSKVKSPWITTDSGKVKLNPLRAVRSTDDFSAVLTKTYLSRQLPAAIFFRINRIVKVPHSGMPQLPGDRDWKYMAPDWEEHGEFWRVFEHLELSGPGGWIQDVYGQRIK